MGIAVGGLLVIIALLLTGLDRFSAIHIAHHARAMAVRDAAETRRRGLQEALAVVSAAAQDEGSDTVITLELDNTGAVALSDHGEMDVLADYTGSSGTRAVTWLGYVTGAPGPNQWSVTLIAPDSFHPALWDPDETATVSLRLAPQVMGGSWVTVVVVGPGGVWTSVVFQKA